MYSTPHFATHRKIRRKLAIFQQVSQTHKQIFLTMISMFGIKKNKYSLELVDNNLNLYALFKEI